MSDVEYLKNEIVIMLKAGRSRSYIINQLKYEGHDEDKIKLIVDSLEDELIKTKRKNLTPVIHERKNVKSIKHAKHFAVYCPVCRLYNHFAV